MTTIQAAASSPGTPFPLGATVTDGGTNFAVVADAAPAAAHGGPSGIELCLFDADGAERRIPVESVTYGIRHVFVPGVGPGTRYGYRVAAHDQAKVLLDPYARRVEHTGYDLAAASTPGAETAGRAPLGVVAAPVHARAARPQIPWEHTVIYEAHVKGLTARHPDVPEEVRGTYAGLAHPAIIEHLQRLHVTALELLPVHAHAAEPLLAAAGRPNYWGYSTLSYFAPHPGYASRPGDEIAEFAAAVDALHDAGIEVILDVVYNHTCEGGPDRPLALSWRGLSPATYYLDGDLTGTGNTVDTGPLPVVRMVTDSLRHWATEFGIDGFRFDLAPVLGRPGGGAFDGAAPLLTAIEADPVLRTRKLIAEPWDATGEGYALGAFGATFAEWNDRFRGTVRDFWRGVPALRDLGYRLTGSQDVFGARGRKPWASVNFVTAHDGFTLRDLVSYERKHNDANGQGGADGTDDNRSANYGVEGDGDDAHPLPPAVAALRRRQARNLAATLLLATGTPMICAGDELWRTQRGNNNAYCIDSPLVWLDWDGGDVAADMLAFFRHVLAVRAAAPALHQGEFFSGRAPVDGDGVADVTWFAPDGRPMTGADWFDSGRRTIALWFDGNDVPGHGPRAGQADADSFLLVLHAGESEVPVTLPGSPYGRSYTPIVDTATATGVPADATPIAAMTTVTIGARTTWLLRAAR